MNDRELLELAAKAVGFKVLSVQHGKLNCHDWQCKRNFHWNSLVDKGDALALAITLGIGMRHHQGWSEVFHPTIGSFEIKHGDCAVAAIQRAITEVAAEIGKGVK